MIVTGVIVPGRMLSTDSDTTSQLIRVWNFLLLVMAAMTAQLHTSVRNTWTMAAPIKQISKVLRTA